MNNDIPGLRKQLQQLQAQHDDGTLDATAYAAAKEGLERQLLDQVLAQPEPATSAGTAASAAASTTPSPSTDLVASPPRPSGKLVALLLAGIVGLAVAGYSYTGSPGNTVVAGSNGPGTETSGDEAAQFAAAVEQLAQRLKSEPDNVEGWAMLARSYARLGQHDKAQAAFKNTGAMLQTDARLMADYADTLAVQNNRSLRGEPAQWIDRALKIEPDNPKALALAGTAAFEAGDFPAAVRHWERLQALLPPDSEFMMQLKEGIAQARQQSAMPAAAAAAPGASTPAAQTAAQAAAKTTAGPAATAAGVQGSVRLAPALAQQVQPGDTVFIFARAAEGPRMPLAILRHQVKDLPLEFKLDDSTAMAPQMRLSLHPKVVISARISKSGQAVPTAGDLTGQSAPVANTARGVAIEINEVVKN
jgi:cytochrome c-type biogenesis protein CcmH